MVAEIFEYPLDLAKVRLQSQVLDSTARFSGPLDCLVRTWQDEGFRGLYRVSHSSQPHERVSHSIKGLPVPIFGAMMETAALFVTYSQLQSSILWCTSDVSSTSLHQLTFSQLGLAAAGSGFFASFIMFVDEHNSYLVAYRVIKWLHRTPIELIKCKMQVQMLAIPPKIPDLRTLPPTFVHNDIAAQPCTQRDIVSRRLRELPGPFSIVSNIVRISGLKGLWVGHAGTVIRETGGTAAWFASKEFFASLLLARRTQSLSSFFEKHSFADTRRTNTNLLPWESAVSGALAGAIYRLSLYPADTVKSAIQTAEELRPPDTFTPSAKVSMRLGPFWKTAKAIYRARGMRGLYAGCGLTIVRAIPSSAIVFVVYDGLTQRFP